MTTVLDLTSKRTTSGVADIEAWLSAVTTTQPETPLLWRASLSATPVRSTEHLSVLVSSLDEGGFGVVEWADGGPARWAQTMRLGGSWIVEVHDGTASDFAHRVLRGTAEDYPRLRDGERRLEPYESFTPFAAASVLWSWQHGSLAEGLSRTVRHLSPRERRKYGLSAS